MSEPLKDCGCFKHREVNQETVTLTVICPDCEGPLEGLNGRMYPVHRLPVRVSQKQVDKWLELGYEIENNGF